MIFHADPRNVADDGDELSIQKRLRSRLRRLAPTCRFVAVPNGGNRTAWEGMKAKQEGMAPGFPDGMVIWPGGCCFVEVKARNGALSDNQIAWLNWLTNAGFRAGMFRSVDTAIAFIRESGAPFMAEAA